jgi:MFS family permease
VSVLFGCGLSIAMVLGITVAQRSAPDEVRGRVMSAIHVLSRIGLIAGSVIVGAIAAVMDRVASSLLPGWDGNRYALLIAGAALVAGGIAAKTGASLIEAEEPAEERTSGESGTANRAGS